MRLASVLTTIVLCPLVGIGCAEGGLPPTATSVGPVTSGGDDDGADTSITTVAPTGGDGADTPTAETMGVDVTGDSTSEGSADTDGGTTTDGGDTGMTTDGGPGSSSDGGESSSSSSGAGQDPVMVCSSPASAIGPNSGTVTFDAVDVGVFNGQLGDVNVEIQATHTFVGDLTVTIEHQGSGTTVTLLSAQCSLNDDIDATFDDAAAAVPACGVPAISGDVLPVGLLSGFNALMDASGSWELSITDGADADGGNLATWCLYLEPA